MNEIDNMPADQLRQVVDFQFEQRRKYQRLFIDGRHPSVVEVGKEAPELFVINLAEQSTDEIWHGYRQFEGTYDTAPFDPDGHKFRMFPGGLTIWSGFPGTGKTTLLRQLVCHLLKRGRGVFMASLEEPPDHMLVRLWMTAAGSLEPTAHQRQWFMDAYGDRLRMWGLIGIAPFQSVLASIRYAIKYEHSQHIVIDSLTCLDIGGSDWDGQRGLANELCALARATRTHIHLVAHPRKPSKPDQSPDIADVAGSSDLGRLVDNVLFVRRTDAESTDFSKPTPMQIVVKKQRHGTGMCGPIEGWFHRADRQFDVQQFRTTVTRYLPDDAYG